MTFERTNAFEEMPVPFPTLKNAGTGLWGPFSQRRPANERSPATVIPAASMDVVTARFCGH